jgi:hypothetical protein
MASLAGRLAKLEAAFPARRIRLVMVWPTRGPTRAAICWASGCLTIHYNEAVADEHNRYQGDPLDLIPADAPDREHIIALARRCDRVLHLRFERSDSPRALARRAASKAAHHEEP